ncbi:MAG: hypothetical protein R3B37_13215 [Nitrospira sp.]|nr:hypothetical protein [Nitrospira sp.]
MSNDTKNIRITGCDVHLTFHAVGDGRWTVDGIVHCGTGEKSDEQAVTSGPCASREAAEQDVLERVGHILGHNVDRHTSRIENPTEKNPR